MVAARSARWVAAVVAALAIGLVAVVVDTQLDVGSERTADAGSVMSRSSDSPPALQSVRPVERLQYGDRRNDADRDGVLVVAVLSVVLGVAVLAAGRRCADVRIGSASVLAVARGGVARRGPPPVRYS